MNYRVLCCAIVVVAQTTLAQNFGAGVSTLHDANIFDTYAPIEDQITQVNLDASKDWDLDQTSLGLAYYGSLLFFNTVSERNYSIHSGFFSAQYQFYRDDEDPDSSEASDDSTGTGELARPAPRGAAAHIDSLDQFLYGSLGGIAQFNKTEFAEYDNSAVIATVVFRQPIVEAVSIRPGYSFSYHAYPNLPGLANFQHAGMLTLGVSLNSNGWLGITGAVGHEQYTETTTFTYTYSDSVPGSNGYGRGVGHGKGGSTAGKVMTRTLTFNFSTPSVDQVFAGALLHQKIAGQTDLTIQGTLYAPPTAGARVIPERIQNAIENRPGTLEGFGTQTEIFDDHFTYSGNELLLQLRQPLPFSVQATAGGIYRHKRFTSPATGILGDTLAPNRLDDRFEGILTLARPVPVFAGRSMTLIAEVHLVRNQSNEPFYDFKKTVVMAGLQMSF